ncbi:MAG: hypothetical protein H6818_18080 [Phycisphaerales bacterium]|nr:hypothetical protein [Phycisphaerales bacterium]
MFLLIFPVVIVIAVIWYCEYRRIVRASRSRASHGLHGERTYLRGVVFAVLLGLCPLWTWYGVFLASGFDWRQYDAASFKLDEHILMDHERRKVGTTIVDDPSDIEQILGAAEGIEAGPGINHESALNGSRSFVIRLCDSSGTESPYWISIYLGPDGKPYSEYRDHLLEIGLDDSSWNLGVYQSDTLARIVRQHLNRAGAEPRP